MKNPCKDCPDKGCGAYHDICQEHIKLKASLEEEKRIINEEKHRLYGRDYICDTTFKHRTHGAFKCRKKRR